MTKLLAIGALVLALCAAAGALVSGILRAHLAYTHASIGWSRAVFDGLRVTLVHYPDGTWNAPIQEGAVGFTQYNPSYLQALSAGNLNQTLIATTPSTGTNGYSFSVQQRYP